MDDRERDLADATTELTETLETLREELRDREPERGPLGLPRPPRPSTVLRFTEQYTIPTVIALLEASIRTLELLAAALRAADGRPFDARESSVRRSGETHLESVGRAGRDRLASTSRETLRRLDEALSELQSAAGGDPSNPELKALLEEARELRAEIDERLTAATEEPLSDGEKERDAETDEIGIRAARREEGTEIDVESELASIKDELDADEPTGPTAGTDPDERNDSGG